jgi:hypothetical protein
MPIIQICKKENAISKFEEYYAMVEFHWRGEPTWNRSIDWEIQYIIRYHRSPLAGRNEKSGREQHLHLQQRRPTTRRSWSGCPALRIRGTQPSPSPSGMARRAHTDIQYQVVEAAGGGGPARRPHSGRKHSAGSIASSGGATGGGGVPPQPPALASPLIASWKRTWSSMVEWRRAAWASADKEISA